MIPIRLELHNFMPYRDPAPLDFAGLHVACLAGENGAGKSALLDAITWALWGKARARRDDELIHLGQTEMEVTFTFRLGENVYRVLRKRKQGARTGQTVLDVQVQQDGGDWRSIGEATVRETQAKIERLLRLDYETFINSALLLQGRADEFTTRTPAERKKVLADILGLQVWEAYEERARARVARLADQVAFFDQQIAEYTRDIDQRPQHEQELHAAQGTVAAVSGELRAAEQAFAEVERTRRELRFNQEQLAALDRRVAGGLRDVQEAETELATRRARLEAAEELLAEREQIDADYAALLDARAADQAFNEKLRAQARLFERRGGLERAVAEARAELSSERRSLDARLRELDARAADAALAGRLESTRAELAAAEARQQDRAGNQARRDAAADEMNQLRGRTAVLQQEAQTIKDRRGMIESATEPVCPLCRQPLGEGERAYLLESYARDLDVRREEYKVDQARIKELGDEVARLDEALKALDRERRALGDLQRQEASLAQRVQAAQAAAEQAAAERERLAALDAQIAQGDYALEEQAALKGVLAELIELGYDAAEHDRVRAWLAGLGPVESRWQDLQLALGGAVEMRERLAQARARAAQVQAALEEERQAQARAQVEVGRLQEALRGSEEREAEVARLREAEALARQKLGAAEQKVHACDELVKTRENRARERAQTAAEQGAYQELALAFGKKGVPAMIIEAAIPEIEEAANELLARMTDSRMHVRLETQREKVTGGIAETLDIKISDELGTRDYALYSGGEAFRVNFAVRIGLSRLLARRAGAQLQLLVLDEGFGALDASGREQLIEAINAVKEDFQCVLVITHIEELRDVFPARIDVKKTEEGSVVQIA